MTVIGGVADVSNICWSPTIAPAGVRRPVLARLTVVRDAWARAFGPDVPLTLIADKSLYWQLARDEQGEFTRLVENGALSTARTADPELLELARDRDLHVLSRDQFLDLRRAHPWIERFPERFLAWRDSSGGLRFVPSGIAVAAPQAKSRAEEAKELSWQHKINVRDTSHVRILRTDWRCTARDCSLALIWPDRLLLWPRLAAGGQALCPHCRGELEELGPRGPVRGVVVTANSSRAVSDPDGENVVLRFPLALGAAVMIGRGELTNGINLGAPQLPCPDARKRVSRRHALLVLEDAGERARLTVTDLGSTGGSAIESSGSGGTRKLEPGRAAALGNWDSLVLGGRDGICVRLSGRRFFADEAVLPQLGSQGSSIATVYD